MLLYIRNKVLKDHTFVEICTPTDSVAKIRALLLHRLHEMGHSHRQFRLKYKNTFLRDAYTLEEYRILNNAVITMIPLDNFEEWKMNMMLHQQNNEKFAKEDCVQQKLMSEIRCLKKREVLLTYYKVFLMMQSLFMFLGFFAYYWYLSIIYLFSLTLSFYFCPSFSTSQGWSGRISHKRMSYIQIMVGCFILSCTLSTTFLGLSISNITSSDVRCLDQTSECLGEAQSNVEFALCNNLFKKCHETSVFTAVFLGITTFLFLILLLMSLYLMKNFGFNLGDFIEQYLIQTRDLKVLLQLLQSGNLYEKRTASFEIATLAASGYNNKLKIVENDGLVYLKPTKTNSIFIRLQILISAALNQDLTIQEYASEIIAECLTIPSIQDQFVSNHGMDTLTVLLHSKNSRTVHEAVTALHYITTDSDQNKLRVTELQGLQDIAYICKYVKEKDLEMLAEIFLELCYYEPSRNQLVSMSTPMKALYELLSKSLLNCEKDLKSLLHILQAFELMAIENPTVLFSQKNLFKKLLEVPLKIRDDKICLLAAKLLVYFSQNTEEREKLISSDLLLDSLYSLTQTDEVTILRTVGLIVSQLTSPFKHREKLNEIGMKDFLSFLYKTTTNKETWKLVEVAETNLKSGRPTSEDQSPKQFLDVQSSYDDQTC